MSLITGADMAVVIRDNANKLFNLMKEYHIEDRRIDANWDLNSIFSTKVDWNIVNNEIEERRANSMAYLTRMITNNA